MTNDPSSRVRAAGTPPGSLAAGRYAISRPARTAVDFLPQEMLLDHHGSWEETYPQRLAERLAKVIRTTDSAGAHR